MLPGDKGRAVDLAVITYLDRARISLEQKRLRPRAAGNQHPDEQRKKEQSSGEAIKGAQSEAASINDWIN